MSTPDAFDEAQRTAILLALQALSCKRWVLFSEKGRCRTPTRALLSAIATNPDNIVAGQLGGAAEDGWKTGDTRVGKFTQGTSLWVGGTGEHLDDAEWAEAWTLEQKFAPPLPQLSVGGQRYWGARQGGQYLDWKGVLAGCDGSVLSSMGASAVLRGPDGTVTAHVCRVGGDSSSFRAEAAAMHQAVLHAPLHLPLAVLTDSMNVVQALQAWDHAEYMRDMRWQRNADIIVQILLAINARASPLTVIKVKSHRGVELNEYADILAGAATEAGEPGEEDDIDTLYVPSPPDSAVTYQWVPEGTDEIYQTADHKVVGKRWESFNNALTTAHERIKDTFAFQLMTHPGWGQHLWHQSRAVSKWSEVEERRWLQMTGRVFSVNTYLRRIDKHPTGECSWCKNGVLETLAHFQCGCPQFTKNRTAAHHSIARAVVAKLKDLRLPNWEFFYEMELRDLSFKFGWASHS